MSRERERRGSIRSDRARIYMDDRSPSSSTINSRYCRIPHHQYHIPEANQMCETHIIPSTHIMQSDPHSTMMKHYIARSMIVTIYTLIARVFGIGNYVSRKHRLWCIGYLTDCNWDNVSDSKIYSVDVRRSHIVYPYINGNGVYCWRIKPYDSVRAWNSIAIRGVRTEEETTYIY